MKKIYILLFSILIFGKLHAQTWDGSTSADWDEPSNWSTNAVPTTTGTVTIPSGLMVYPKLSTNIEINRIDMAAGSSLDVAGKLIKINNTAAGYIVWVGATISNSNGASDINISLSTGVGGFNTQINGCTFSDNVTFTISGSNQFYEANITANVYQGDVKIFVNGSSTLNMSNSGSSTFGGDLEINRTVAGATNIFGGTTAITVAGDFYYYNNTSGAVNIGNTTNKTVVTGTFRIDCPFAILTDFSLINVENQTSNVAANILIDKGNKIDIEKNKLKINEIRLTNFKNGYVEVLNNQIVGDVYITTAIDFVGGFDTRVYSNTITGTCYFSNAGNNTFFEGEGTANANTFNGDVYFNGTGTGTLNISNNGSSTFNGSLTIYRSTAGITNAFNGSSTSTISGDFFYINEVGGATTLGNTNSNTTVDGQVSINVNLASPAKFDLFRIVNTPPVVLSSKSNTKVAAGGSIIVNNIIGFNISGNDVTVERIQVTNYTSGGYGIFSNNKLNGDLYLTTSTIFAGGYNTRVFGNTVNGNSLFVNSGTNDFYEGQNVGEGNTFNGLVGFEANSTGAVSVGVSGSSIYNGDLAIIRTVTGTTNIFNGTSNTQINGNFSLTNNIGGNTYLGNNTNATTVTGTLTIKENLIAAADFEMRNVNNQQPITTSANKQAKLLAGGIIEILNTKGFLLEKNNLDVAQLSVKNYKSGDYGRLLNNNIIGEVFIFTANDFGGGYNTTIYGNTFTGICYFQNNGSNAFYEGHVNQSQANTFNGNVFYEATSAGALYIGEKASSTYNGSLDITRSFAGITEIFSGESATVVNGNFKYTNNIGGNSVLGNNTNETLINGTFTIASNQVSTGNFLIRKINNLGGTATTNANTNARISLGGNIDLKNTRGFTIDNSKLNVPIINVENYTGDYGYLRNNTITGDVYLSTSNTYGGGYSTSVLNNTITGNCSFSNNGTNVFNDGTEAMGGNTYNGDISYTKTGAGIINVATITATNEISGSLTQSATSGINLGNIKFIGMANSNIYKFGSQAISIEALTIEKTQPSHVILNAAVIVTKGLNLVSGNINTTATNFLEAKDNLVLTGGSATSFVDGPMKKLGNDIFSFPIGKNSKYAPISITAPASATTSLFTAEYKDNNPTTDGYDITQKAMTLDHILAQEYWLLDGNSPVFVTLGWDAARSGQVNPLASARVAHWTGSTWEDRGKSETTGNPNLGTVKSGAAIPSFSPFAIASTEPFVPLPLNLISFTGKNTENGNVLNWKTANEVAFSHFEIERSIDAKKFEKIGEKMATGGPAEKVEYEYIDDLSQLNSELDEKYYRLKMINLDGSFKFSKIVNIDTRPNSDFVIFPNPAIEYFKIVNNEKIQMVEIMDLAGNTIKTFRKSIDNQYNVKDLTKGVYMIKTTSNVGFNIRKLVIN